MPASLHYQDGPDRFLADAVNLGASLDSPATQEDLTSIRRLLTNGRQQYFALAVRRLTLDFTPAESAIALWMMDIIQSRLTVLDRLMHQTVQRPLSTRKRNPRTGIRLIKG